jgi:hypothetical protein
LLKQKTQNNHIAQLRIAVAQQAELIAKAQFYYVLGKELEDTHSFAPAF